MDKYDLIIVGGGAGGFSAATRASELGAKALLINAGLPIGGTCVNVGCVPSKLLLEMGAEYYYPRHPRFRAVKNGSPPSFDFPTAIREKDEIISALRESNYTRVAQALGVPVVEGKAHFVSSHRVEVNGQGIEADKFIIATGSRPKVLPFPGIEKVRYLTSREALSLSRLPQSLIVIGAGPLGLEFAQMFSRFGSRVTVIEKESQILPQAEPEVAGELGRCLEEEGIEFHTGVDVLRVGEAGGLKTVEARRGQRSFTLSGEELLLAAGVTPNSDGMGLDAVGVGMGRSGFILVSKEMRTTVPHIWAAGDVVGKAFLETVAAKEGYIAVGNALEGTQKSIDYDSVPRAVFTDPQVATVGLTEVEFMRRFKTCSCQTVPIAQVPKARAVGESRGLVKMIVHPTTGVIAGVHMVAPGAAELIHEATLAVKFQLTLDQLIDTVHVFPTFSEAIKLVAQSFKRDITRMSCCVE